MKKVWYDVLRLVTALCLMGIMVAIPLKILTIVHQYVELVELAYESDYTDKQIEALEQKLDDTEFDDSKLKEQTVMIVKVLEQINDFKLEVSKNSLEQVRLALYVVVIVGFLAEPLISVCINRILSSKDKKKEEGIMEIRVVPSSESKETEENKDDTEREESTDKINN